MNEFHQSLGQQSPNSWVMSCGFLLCLLLLFSWIFQLFLGFCSVFLAILIRLREICLETSQEEAGEDRNRQRSLKRRPERTKIDRKDSRRDRRVKKLTETSKKEAEENKNWQKLHWNLQKGLQAQIFEFSVALEMLFCVLQSLFESFKGLRPSKKLPELLKVWKCSPKTKKILFQAKTDRNVSKRGRRGRKLTGTALKFAKKVS